MPTDFEKERRNDLGEERGKIVEEINGLIKSISAKEDRKKRLVEPFTAEKLSKLEPSDLRDLLSVLNKINEDQLLTSAEAGLLRYLASSGKEESLEEKSSNEEVRNESEEFGEGQMPEEEPKEEEGNREEREGEEKEGENGEKEESEEESLIEGQEGQEGQTESSSGDVGDVERKVLSLEEAEVNLSKARREYLKEYRQYVRLSIKVRKEKDDAKRLKLQEELQEVELILNNAKRLYSRALEEYKLALYFDLLRKKKDYLFKRVKRTKRKHYCCKD